VRARWKWRDEQIASCMYEDGMNSAETMASYAAQLTLIAAAECPVLGSPAHTAMMLNAGQGVGTWSPKAGMDGASMVDMAAARDKIEAKRRGGLKGESDL
jgi:hypothetical protein